MTQSAHASPQITRKIPCRKMCHVNHVRKHLPVIIEDLGNGLSWQARDYLSVLFTERVDCDAAIAKYESRIVEFAKADESCKRLLKITGVGPLETCAASKQRVSSWLTLALCRQKIQRQFYPPGPDHKNLPCPERKRVP